MRHTMLTIGLILAMALGLAGCAKQQDDIGSEVINDSLLTADPREPSGDLTPQEPFPSPEAPPRQAPKPKRAAQGQPTPQQSQESQPMTSTEPVRAREAPGVVVRWGSFLRVALSDSISSETAQPGDAWTGTLADSVFGNDRVALPAGSIVHGRVVSAKPAEAGDRASLELAVTSIDAFGKAHSVSGKMEPLVAGSPRLRNVAGIAGGTAAGALIGKVIGGGKGAVVGGLLGGAAAGTAVARSKGYQVVLKPGNTVSFTVAEDAVVRR